MVTFPNNIMTYLNKDYVISLIEKTYDFQTLDNEVMDRISEPDSDRPNPYSVERDIELLDDDKGVLIRCTAVVEVSWVYYNNCYKHNMFREEVPDDSWTLNSDDVEFDDYEVVEVYNIKADI